MSALPSSLLEPKHSALISLTKMWAESAHDARLRGEIEAALSFVFCIRLGLLNRDSAKPICDEMRALAGPERELFESMLTAKGNVLADIRNELEAATGGASVVQKPRASA